MSVGNAPVVECHTAHVACRVTNILSRIDRKSGQELELEPASLKNGDAGFVRFEPLRPLCIEPFHHTPSLARFVLRDKNHLIAVGLVKSVDRKQ